MHAEVEKYLHEKRIAIQSDARIIEKKRTEFEEPRKQFDCFAAFRKYIFYMPIMYCKRRYMIYGII